MASVQGFPRISCRARFCHHPFPRPAPAINLLKASSAYPLPPSHQYINNTYMTVAERDTGSSALYGARGESLAMARGGGAADVDEG